MFERFMDYIIFIYQISQNMSIPPLPRSSLRPLRGSAIHSSAASPVLIRRPFFIPLIHLVWEIDYIMIERLIGLYLIMFERLIGLCSERLDPLFLFIKSLRTCLFLRLFLPPRLRRLLRLYILTAVTPDLPLYHFIGRGLLSLPIIVSVLSVGRNRWHNHRWLIIRRSYAASPVHSYGAFLLLSFFMFERFDSIRFIIFDRSD